MVDSEVQNIILSITEFAQNLHMELETDLRDQLFSPINIHSLVVLLSSDPWFCNKEFFNAVLKIDVNSAATHYKHFFQALSHINDLKITNTCFSNANTVMQDDFKLQVKENFVHSINELDFTKTEATQTINSWIGDKTQGKLTFGGLNKDSWITFLSALHFKGNWSIPFASEETVSSPFYLNDQSSVDVRMMRRKDVFSYSYDEYLKTKILKLPFAGGQASLFIVLPNEGTSITELEAEPYFRYRPICSVTMSETEVDVSLPKFKLGESLELTECLKKIGLEEMFDACLAGVLEGGKELSCNQILQKVLLDVNETGAEAVAATHATLVEHRDEKILPKDGLVVYESKISSKVSNRFAKTVVVWRVKNTNANTADAKFKVILTDTAFITEFVMEIQGKSYKSYIKETEEAKNIYDEAVTQGRSAGLVEAKTRDSREFTVSVNLEPDSTAIFSLTYEEMLQRIHDQYELVLNINPGQIVDNLIIEVSIDESSPLKFVNIPPMRTGSDRNMTGLNKELDPKSTVEMKTSRNAFIKFCPDPVQQKKMTHYLGNKFNGGLSGQFVVQYDVERQPLNGEVLLLDGYFVHFFAPNDLDPLPKHIVFVLDTSTSMTGRKMDQLKDAMMNILGDLRMEDMLSILEFNSDVQVWDVATKNSTVLSEDLIKDFKEPFAYLKECILADPQRVSDSIISTAREVVQEISPCGCTFMIGGLETALYVVSMGRKQEKRKSDKLQPIIVFLTDGEPNVGIDSTDKIVELVTNLNSKDTVPIFSLSFGDDADKNFLRKLSLNNLGFSRHIYEAADASLQLQDFYKQISSPLLNDINFKYERDVAEVTRTRFPIYFRGSELVVAGRCKECDLPAHVDCRGPTGPVVIRSSIERPVTSLERLWAYLTVKQLLDDRETAANPDELTKKAVDLALRYSFVTDVTSLVVVKPDAGDTTLGTRINTNAGGNIDLDVEANPVPFLCYEQPEDITYSQKMKSPKKKVMKKRMIKKRKGDWRSDCEPVQAVEDYITEVEPPELPEDKPTEEFKANRPFLVMLQVDIEGTSLILFQGRVLKPIY